MIDLEKNNTDRNQKPTLCSQDLRSKEEMKIGYFGLKPDLYASRFHNFQGYNVFIRTH